GQQDHGYSPCREAGRCGQDIWRQCRREPGSGGTHRSRLAACGSPGDLLRTPKRPLQGSAYRDAGHDLPTRVAHQRKSLRPQHTVEPLAELIGQDRLRLDFSEGEEQRLVAAAVAADGVVLISWHHAAIPAIKDATLGDHSEPRKWDKNRFDVVW